MGLYIIFINHTVYTNEKLILFPVVNNNSGSESKLTHAV